MVNFADQARAIAILVDYFFGLAFGVIGGAIFGSVRESRRMSLLQQAPDPVSAGARVLFGLFMRDDGGYLRGLLRAKDEASGHPREDDGPESHGQELGR